MTAGMQRTPAHLRRTGAPTAAGITAILFWSSTVGVARRISERLGAVQGAALVFLLAGLLGVAAALASPARRKALTRLPRRYLFVCGPLFVLYSVLLYVGVGYSIDARQVIGVGLLNYLWPALIIVFAVVRERRTTRPLPLVAGICAGIAGGWVAMVGGAGEPWRVAFGRVFGSAPPGPYLCGVGAAVAWGLYSNLSKAYASDGEGGGVSFFLLATGVALLAVAKAAGLRVSVRHVDRQTLLMIGYMALVPSLLAYTLWDYAVRRGRLVLIGSLSYATPLLSTALSSAVLSVTPGGELWTAALLVVGGALLCRFGAASPEAPER